MSRKRGAVVVALVVIGLGIMSSTCFAADYKGDNNEPQTAGLVKSSFTLLHLGQLPSLAVLAVNISRGHRPSDGWLAAGYITGAVALTSGIAAWEMAAREDNKMVWVAGIPNLVLGISNIVLASYGLTLPVAPEGDDEEGQGAQISFAPLVAPDGQGGYYSGVGVSVVGW